MKPLVVTIVILIVVLLGTVKTGAETLDWQAKADRFLESYLADFGKRWTETQTCNWNAVTSGKPGASGAFAAAYLAYKRLHSDGVRFKQLEELLAHKDRLDPITARSLEVAEPIFRYNRLPKEMSEKLTAGYVEMGEIRNAFRAVLDGKKYSNHELRKMLEKEMDTPRRQKIWDALTRVGDASAPKMIELAKVRNDAARKAGYKDYWDMNIRSEEYDPDELSALFSQLERLTGGPYKRMKAELDDELAVRFKIKTEELMPWHYGNPLFELKPPYNEVDIEQFYKDKKKEDILRFARGFYKDIGLPVDDILARSDLYHHEGKRIESIGSMDIDRNGDVRIILYVEPSLHSMHAALHELGHAVYALGIDKGLPVNLRDAAHAFTNEAVAMLFGALSRTPAWIVDYAGADPQRMEKVQGAILEQRRREQLIFARWTMVIFYFEKAFYENPDRDLNTLWWDLIERYQLLRRPRGRDEQGRADWAVKRHLASSPVYYHNYLLGELLAAQIRAVLVKMAKHDGPAVTLDYRAHHEFGEFFKEKIFKPGKSVPWPEFVKNATGEPLTAKYFAEELERR